MSSNPNIQSIDKQTNNCNISSNVMRGIVQTGYGSIKDNISLNANLVIPSIKSDELLIRVHYGSINPADYKFVFGYFSSVVSRKFPYVLGFDLSGEIINIGEKVKSMVKDLGFDPVIGMKIWSDTGIKQQAFAEYVAIPAKLCTPIPNNISLREAAAIPLVGLTAYQGLITQSKLKSKSRVFIIGGASGCGHIAIQLAKSMDCYVVATCSTRNTEFVQSFGADRTIDYTAVSWISVLGEEKDKFDLIYDCQGNKSDWMNAAKILKPGGTFCTIRGDTQGKTTIGSVLGTAGSVINRKFWSLFGSPDYVTYLTATKNNRDLFALKELVEKGLLKVSIEKEYKLEEFIQFFQASEAGKVKGKIIIKIINSDQLDIPSEEKS